GKVILFYTCFVNYNAPEIGKAAVAVLERNGIGVLCPEQRCCGMPFLDGGDIASASANARFNVEQLSPLVREGSPVIVPGPTCSYVLKQEYPLLVEGEEARALAARTYDLCEYLMRLKEEGQLDTSFVKPMGRIAYHLPCHLKAQNIGYKSLDLLKLIPGTTVDLIEGCSGIDGTWGLKREYFNLSFQVADRLLKGIREARPDLVVSDCPLAGLQIEQGTERKPLHPIQVLKEAYGL
ncbi:MAG: heterodisulfide reductase-related iron-sulfur binding cluster, partial [Candidatus Methylomirabilales bacterium]